MSDLTINYKPNSKQTRQEKRKSQRESLNKAFGDSLVGFSIPEIVRKHSAELDEAAKELHERERKISSASQERVEHDDGRQAQHFLETREQFVNDAATFLKKGKSVVKDLRAKDILDRATAKRAYKDLDGSDTALVKERAALVTNRIKLRYGILSHTSHARIGEAYLAAIVEYMPEPAGAQIKKQGSRNRSDQTGFRKRLEQAYNWADYKQNETNHRCWCPVMKKMVLDRYIIAAHIVPYSIGEVNAAYLFGLDQEKGYEAIWDNRNGLLLHEGIEKAFDAARVIIVQDEEDPNELKLVVMDDSLMDVEVSDDGVRFGELHQRRLEFKTNARPGRRNLYLHYLLALFRRKRFNVNGWERDSEKAKSGYVWGTPGPWLRRSIIKALAFEIGDADRLDKIISADAGVADFPDALSETKEAGMAVQIRQALESEMMQEK
jgi:hypothetical protein